MYFTKRTRRATATLLIIMLAALRNVTPFTRSILSSRCMSTQNTFLRSTEASQASEASSAVPPPVYRAEGLFAVDKPLHWTSSQVVSYLRGILERDARTRGAQLPRRSPRIKMGHGGTLDPLANGVLVLGIGHGTKQLQRYVVYCVRRSW
jgi:hypothetical protein